MARDAIALAMLKQVKEGKTHKFRTDGELLYFGEWLYVPKSGNLRREVLRECHDTLWAGHPGQNRTLALAERRYYWERIRQDVEQYVKTCLVCQQDKPVNTMQASLLHLLPILEKPWVSVSMDFISPLPLSRGYNRILVIVDRFTKYATFIPTKVPCAAEEVAKMFFKKVVKLWGLPLSIVSDRDTRFTGRFWTELFRLVGMKLLMNTSYHPQTNG